MRFGRVAVLAVALVTGACSGGANKEAKKPPMTQRQRDSAIGEMRLPGAQGIRGALRVQDSAAARNARLDTIDP